MRLTIVLNFCTKCDKIDAQHQYYRLLEYSPDFLLHYFSHITKIQCNKNIPELLQKESLNIYYWYIAFCWSNIKTKCKNDV